MAKTTTVDEGYGACLQRLREKAGLTRYALAKLAGLSPIHLTRLETEPGAEPKISTAVRIADSLGVSVEEFARCVREKKGRAGK